MTRREDGGAAYPRPISTNGLEHPADRLVAYEQDGMSLRDYFAGQALTQTLSRDYDLGVAAREAYRAADAMLAERDK